MGSTSCIIDDCEEAIDSRGLCARHYSSARRKGTLEQYPRKLSTEWHQLTNVDKDLLRADCSVCGPDTEVRLRSATRLGTRSAECMTVVRAYRKRRVRRWSSEKRSQRAFRLKSKYNLTTQEYEDMKVSQEGRCAICNTTPKILVVDHCHSSGRVRGLLCASCNKALGFLRDNAEAARRAATYLSANDIPDGARRVENPAA